MEHGPHTHDGCAACRDEAVPMQVVAVDQQRSLALCGNERGARLSVEIGLIEPVAVGELLLVHAGTAIARASTGRDERGLGAPSGRIRPTGRGAGSGSGA